LRGENSPRLLKVRYSPIAGDGVRREPGLGEPAGRIAHPVRDPAQPSLLRQILRHRADKRIEPGIAGQPWLLLDRGEPGIVGLGEILARSKLSTNSARTASRGNPA